MPSCSTLKNRLGLSPLTFHWQFSIFQRATKYIYLGRWVRRSSKWKYFLNTNKMKAYVALVLSSSEQDLLNAYISETIVFLDFRTTDDNSGDVWFRRGCRKKFLINQLSNLFFFWESYRLSQYRKSIIRNCWNVIRWARHGLYPS